MANELGVHDSNASGQTVYAIIRNTNNEVWNDTDKDFEDYTTANYTDYIISLTEQGTASKFYVSDFPPEIGAGMYDVMFHEQSGGGPAEGDSLLEDFRQFDWNGADRITENSLAQPDQILQNPRRDRIDGSQIAKPKRRNI